MRWLFFLFPPLVFLLVVVAASPVGAQPPTPGLPPPQTPSSNPFPQPDPDCGNCFLVCTGGTPTPTRTPSPTPTSSVSPTPTPTPTPTPVPTPTPTPLPSQLSAVGTWSTAPEGSNGVFVMMNSVSCGSSDNNRSGTCRLENEILSDAFIAVTTTSDWGTLGRVDFVGFQAMTYSLGYNLRSYCGSRGCGTSSLDVRFCNTIPTWPWSGPSAYCPNVLFSTSASSGSPVSGTFSFSVQERGVYRVSVRVVGGAYGNPDRGSAEGWVEFFAPSLPPPPPPPTPTPAPTPTPVPTPACEWIWDSSPPEPGCRFLSSGCLIPPCSGSGDSEFEYSCNVGALGDVAFSLAVFSTSTFTVSFGYAPEAGLVPVGTVFSSIRGAISPPPGILIDSSSSDYSLSGDTHNLGSMYVAVDCGSVRPPPPTPTPTPMPGDRCHPPAPPGCYWSCSHPIPRPEQGTCFSWDIPPSWAAPVLGDCHTYRVCLYDIIPQISATLWPLTYFVSRLFVTGLLIFYGLVLVIRYFSRK